MKNKINKLQIARFISQLIFLFLLPGLFALSFSEIGKFYSSIIKGNFNLISLIASLTAAITTLLASIIFGRFFCGWMCSFGFMNDLLYKISSKIFKFKFKVDEKTDRLLKYVKYVILVLIAILIWTLGASSLNVLNPWNAFAQITNFKTAIFQYTLGFIILFIIIIGCMFIERFFCRYLCPLGAIFSLISRFRLFNISKPNDKCGKCRLCTNKCSMGIPLYKTSKVTSGECIMCLKCVETCPRKNTQLNVAGENVNPALASSAALAAIIGVYGVTNVANNIINKNGSSISSSVSTSSTKGQYKDGTYTGTGTGFNPGMKVSVTVKNGNISSIEILSNNDTPDYFNQAASTVPNEIIKAQSTSVDAVSGATRSSNGIMSAVSDALKNAKSGSSSQSSSTTNNSTVSNNENSSSASENSSINENSSNETSESNNNTSTTTNSATYKDGTYTGTGNGFRPGLQVSVTVKSGKISNIEIVSSNDTPRFFDEASSAIPDEIIKAQSTNVDAVSGATRSSNGIMEAVSNALKNAM